LFDDPSIAQQISDKVRQIANDSRSIKRDMSAAGRSTTAMKNNFEKLVDSTTKVADNFSKIIPDMQRAAASAGKVGDNTDKAAVAAGKYKNNMNGAAKSVGGVLLAGLAFVISKMIRLQQEGAAFEQIIDISVQSFKNLGQIFRTGVLAGMDDLSMATVNIGRGLGDIRGISNELIESSVELSNVYNVSEKSAAKITAQLFRWNGRNNALVKSAQQYNVALAKANGILPGDLIEQMAQNTNELARFANQGAEGFAKQVIQLNKMGVSMQSMSVLGDKLVMNFEGSLESAAKLQTFLPGFDMSGIQFASQFGTNADIATELQTALQRSGISSLSQLPRSLQNAISGSLGVSLSEIENLLTNTAESSSVAAPTVQDLDNVGDKLANSVLKAISGLVAVIRGPQGVGGILTYLIGRDVAKFSLGRGGIKAARGMVGRGIAMAGGIGGVGVAAAAGLGGYGIGKLVGDPKIGALGGAATGAASGALIGSVFPVIGTITGAVVGGIAGALGGLLGGLNKSTKTQEELIAVTDKMSTTMENKQLKAAASAAGVVNFDFAQTALAQQKLTTPPPRINPNLASATPINTANDSGLNKATLQQTKSAITVVSSNTDIDTKPLENKMDQLITLMRNGGIAVNLDGRKISTGLMETNRYG
jgi:gas vesicle protein